MNDLADYEAWKAKQQQQSVAAANAVLVNAAEQNPDEVAGNLTLADEFAKTTGNPRPPTPLVAEYKNTFQALIEQKKNETILSSAPQLTEWLRNPANAVIARDDLQGLSTLETIFGATKNALSAGVQVYPQAANQFGAALEVQGVRDRPKSILDIAKEEAAPPGMGWSLLGDRKVYRNLAGPLGVVGDTLGRYALSRMGDTDEKRLANAAELQKRAGLVAKAIDETAFSPAATAFKDKFAAIPKWGDPVQWFADFAPVVANDPKGFVAFLAETAARSLPGLAAATVGTVATKNPTVGATILGLNSAVIEAGTAPVEFFREHNIDVTTPEGAIRAIQDKKMWDDAIARGMTRGVVIGIMDGISGGVAGKTIAASPVANTVLNTMLQGIMGSTGEALGQVASGQQIDFGQILLEGLAEFVTAPIEAAGPGGRAIFNMRRKADEAEVRAGVIDQVDATTAASKLRERHPDTFRDFVATATEGTPTQNLFVPAQEFVTYFQGLGVDPYALADSLEGVSRDDLTAAIAAGDDLQIPTATYAAKISGTEYAPFFKENAKFQPGEMSLREAADFKAREPQILDETWKAAQETQRRDMLDNAGFEDVRAEMSARFRAAGRSAEVASTEALKYAAFYRTMAARTGQTVDDFMRAYPLPVVQGAIAQGMQFRDVDALNRTLAEARAAKPKGDKRQGLLDFIANYGGVIDLGGELKARDAETLHQPGKKKLRLSRDATAPAEKGKGYGPDDVARAAVDAGFMADVPAVAEYKQAVLDGRETPDIVRAFWDAVDAELRGRADGADANPGAVPVEEYLARLGLTLNDSDAVIKEAIRKDQAGQTYEQPAYHGTPHLFEKFSTEQIGTGEGAQVYGWGLYFASEKGVAQHYRNTLARAAPEITIDGAEPFDLGKLDRSMDRVELPPDMLEALRPYLKWPEEKYPWRSSRITAAEYLATEKGEIGISLKNTLWHIRQDMADGKSLEQALDLREKYLPPRDEAVTLAVLGALRNRIRVSRPTGRLFEVEVPDDEHLMNWDAPVSEQPAPVREALTALGVGEPKVVPPEIVKRAQSIVKRAVKLKGDTWLSVALTLENDQKLYREAQDIQAEFGPGEAGDNLGDWIIALAKPQAERAEGYTAKTAYETLSARLGADKKDAYSWTQVDGKGRNDKAASEALRAAGIPGHRYVGWESKTTNYVIYDDTRVAVRSYEQRMDRGGPRGALALPAGGFGNGDTVIRLFETADLSTVIHESGHYFLSVMQDIAAKGEQNAATDLATINAWWRENAAAVAKDGQKVTGTAITEADVLAVLDNGTTGDLAKDAAVDVGQQEQFARAFEAYLMEGKAPSADLRSAFEKFRAWLIAVYRSLVNLNVKVSDDIRAVMDRMIATDEEIAKAKEDAGDGAPIFATAEQMGLSQEEFDGILKMRAQAEDEAKARLLQETMEPIRRERERSYKEAKAEVLAEVEKEVNGLYVYRALEWMGNRRWLGDGQPEAISDFRLSKEILVERYGEGVLKTLPRGKQTIYAVEGGVDPDLAADLFGFGSGDEMIRALERATPRQEAIKAELDKAMAERYPDPLTDGDIEAKALDAVHVDKRGMWIAAELKAVTEVAGRDGAMTMKQARVAARQTIARMKVRDAVNAGRFLAAERRASTEAASLGAMLARDGVWLKNAQRRIASKARAALRGDGTVDAAAKAIDDFNDKLETTTSTFNVAEQNRVSSKGNAYIIPGGERTSVRLGYNDLVQQFMDAKRKQLLNHALYMEARKVEEEVRKGENFVRRLNKATTRERIAGAGRRDNAQIDYLAAIDEILERYDFRKMSGTAEDRRGSLMDFVEAMKAAGRENELNIPESVMRQAARAPYKTLPVEQFRGVIDSLKNLEHVASRWDALIDAQNKRNLDVVVTDIVAAFDANMPKRPPGRVPTRGENIRASVRKFLDLTLTAATMLREIDGFKSLGATYANIKSPIDAAEGRLIVRKNKAADDLKAVFSVYTKDEQRLMGVREHVPALGYPLSKWERIAVALNAGNEGNLQRLTDPRVNGSLTEAQIGAVLATLDARDAKFVQSVWDYVGTFKEDIAARERRVTGTEPAWVEAKPVEIAGQMLRGGYYPIKYDPRLSSLSRDDDFNELIKSLQAGRFGKAQTKNGHLEARAQSSGRAVSLDIMNLHRHVNQVIYDLEFSEPVANAWRILQDERVRSAFTDAGRQPDFDALETWLQDVGTGQLHAGDWISKSARIAKSNFTAAKLAANLVTAATQIAGVAQTVSVVGAKDFSIGVSRMFRAGVAEEVMAKSAYMSSRATTFNKDIYDFRTDPTLGSISSRWGDLKKDWIGPLSFWLMTKVQWKVDVPTWLGGYNQGLRLFDNDEAKAIAHADGLVKRAQASGLFSDRSAIERGSVSRSNRQNDVVRLFTTLASYQFAKFNIAYEKSVAAGRSIRDKGVSVEAAKDATIYAVDMVLLFIVDALVIAAIKGKLPDEDDEKNKSWTKFLAKETGMAVMGTVPLIRDIAGPLQGFDGGGAYGAVTKDIAAPFLQLAQGEFDKPMIKSIINAVGLSTGLPALQVNRFVDAAWRANEGEDVPVLDYILGKRGKK